MSKEQLTKEKERVSAAGKGVDAKKLKQIEDAILRCKK
jgi:hypothetical protein